MNNMTSHDIMEMKIDMKCDEMEETNWKAKNKREKERKKI